MKFNRVLPPPGWSRWWILSAILLGLVLPSALAAIVTVGGYYPLGIPFSGSALWGDLGVAFAILGTGTIILIAAPIYSLLAWSWRPIVLALILVIVGMGGIAPAIIGAKYLRLWGFDLFSRRSEDMVNAIEEYSRATGAPPATLAALVPDYLPSIPKTGMAAQPDYRYEPKSGPCSVENAWHLWVSVTQFIDMNRLLYCPKQDYPPARDDVLSRTVIGTWVHDHIDF
ncbi:MAG TPA: hypothetical protein VFE34_00710 [Dongiaceae bacterium]|jgi:hypothetical protein|nr:hypothetical protein [Dongiaceae bacterium]